MIPVKQSKLYCLDGIHNGNCFAATLASLLELPLWMVPPFEDMFGRNLGSAWHERVSEWLKKFFNQEWGSSYGRPISEIKIDDLPEFYIACGKSARGVFHSVIYSKGEMVHDPHPSNSGVLEVEWVEYLKEIK